MSIPRCTLALIAGTLALAALFVATGRADDDEVSAIRRLLDKQVEDWNRKDLDGFLEGYWHAPGVVFQSGAERFDGFEALRSAIARATRPRRDGPARLHRP